MLSCVDKSQLFLLDNITSEMNQGAAFFFFFFSSNILNEVK